MTNEKFISNNQTSRPESSKKRRNVKSVLKTYGSELPYKILRFRIQPMYIGFAETDDPSKLLFEIVLGAKSKNDDNTNDSFNLVFNSFRSR